MTPPLPATAPAPVPAAALPAAVPAAALPALLADRSDALERLTDGLDGAALWWLSGYAAGLARTREAGVTAAPAGIETAPASGETVIATVLYGSQTGNARRLAERLVQHHEAAGLPVQLQRADTFDVRGLRQARLLYLVISTQGDGEAPDDARALVEHLMGRRAPRLEQLRFAVLGLGDSSYPKFCAIGQQLDDRLQALGATRLFARGDADLDVETVATPWLAQALDATRTVRSEYAPTATVTHLRPPAASAPHAGTRDRPYHAEVLAQHPLTGRPRKGVGGTRDIRHVELSLDGSGLTYEPGDALGVWPTNPPATVESVLEALRLDGDAPVTHGNDEAPLREWMSTRREITRLARPVIAAHAERAGDDTLRALLAPDRAEQLAAWLRERQWLDVLNAHPAAWDAADLVATLRPLTPRLYSIASSRTHVGDEAHLTVAHVAYDRDGDPRWGAASATLARATEGERLPVFIEPNDRFRLPADPSHDIVMIGPGTGVAPFRGFVQERAAVGATGRHWLLFGNPHARTDFLYQLEWQRALRDGTLHRMDVAFSRDQADKVYVQHRLREHGRALFDWLEGGAHLYVCGATAMARDVHVALADVLATHGGVSREDAVARLDELQQQGRYARDVY